MGNCPSLHPRHTFIAPQDWRCSASFLNNYYKSWWNGEMCSLVDGSIPFQILPLNFDRAPQNKVTRGNGWKQSFQAPLHYQLSSMVHPAANWQNIQKYLPPCHQTMELLQSHGHEAPELIPSTQGHKVFNHYFIFKHLFKKMTINIPCTL